MHPIGACGCASCTGNAPSARCPAGRHRPFASADRRRDEALRGGLAVLDSFHMDKTPQSLLAELQQRVSELFRSSPAADIERNLKAMLAQTFQRVELVTRDEFDTQLERLSRLQERVESLERRLAEYATDAAGGAAQTGTTSASEPPPTGAAGAAGAAGAGAAGAGAIPMPGPSASPDDAGPVI